jgi:TM2 domain-containing membrane protein YozV
VYPFGKTEVCVFEHGDLVVGMSAHQQALFVAEYNAVRKDTMTAVLLALFLGGLGAHQFYLGQILLGVLYLLFFWTFIPMIIALIELFFLSGRVRQVNRQRAELIAARVRAYAAGPVPATS